MHVGHNTSMEHRSLMMGSQKKNFVGDFPSQCLLFILSHLLWYILEDSVGILTSTHIRKNKYIKQTIILTTSFSAVYGIIIVLKSSSKVLTLCLIWPWWMTKDRGQLGST